MLPKHGPAHGAHSRHRAAHAAHLLTIGTSHRVLTEGFASYASNQPGTADPQDTNLFSQAIEGLVTAGTLPSDEYPLAARFVGMTIERHGMAAFKAFWRKVPRNAQLAEVRTTYEASFGESWSDGLAAIASREQTSFSDPYCEGDVQVVGDSLKRTFAQKTRGERGAHIAARRRSCAALRPSSPLRSRSRAGSGRLARHAFGTAHSRLPPNGDSMLHSEYSQS